MSYKAVGARIYSHESFYGSWVYRYITMAVTKGGTILCKASVVSLELLAGFMFFNGFLRGIDVLWEAQYSWATWLTNDVARNQMSPPTALGFTIFGMTMLMAITRRHAKGNFVFEACSL